MSSIFLIYLPRNSDTIYDWGGLLVSLADLKTKKQKEKKMKTLKTHLTTVVEFLSVAVEWESKIGTFFAVQWLQYWR